MAARTVADQLVGQLVDAGVRRIYGIVGDSLNPVVDAVRRTGGTASGGIDWIHVRHEEAAAFAAAADAQLTGELAVCAGSCGPGNLHLINGLYDAHRSGAPVLAIASHIPSTQIGSGYFQETHPDRLFVECSTYTELISAAAQAPRVLQSAMSHALAGPGVAVVTLPGDIAALPSEGPAPRLVRTSAPTVVPAESDVRALAEAIDAADKIAIFAGAGVRGAREEVLDLAETVAAPIGHSLRGKDWIQRALLLDPDNRNVLYNVACGLTFRNSDLEGALELLDQYFERADSPAYILHAEIDPDMDPLRGDPRFKTMLAEAKVRLGMVEAAV